MLNPIVMESIEKSVLCWLATVDAEGIPNVSPKEMFLAKDEKTLLIAHIASPNSVNNILTNPNVCVSFVDVFAQKGFKLKGVATILTDADKDFTQNQELIYSQLGGRAFTIKAVIAVNVIEVQSILAPSYWRFPDTTEASQREAAMKAYGVKPVE